MSPESMFWLAVAALTSVALVGYIGLMVSEALQRRLVRRIAEEFAERAKEKSE